MPVNNAEVVALYEEQNLTMQEIAERLGVTKARVHQILRAAGVKTGYRFRERPRAEKAKSGKAYRAYRFTPEVRELIDRLAEALSVSRTVVVTRAVEELARRELKVEGQGDIESPGRSKKSRGRG